MTSVKPVCFAIALMLASPALAQMAFDPSDPRLKHRPPPPSTTFEEERAIYSTRDRLDPEDQPHTLMIDRGYVNQLKTMSRRDRAKALEAWQDPANRSKHLPNYPAAPAEEPVETPASPVAERPTPLKPKVAEPRIAQERKATDPVRTQNKKGERITDGRHESELLVGDDPLRESYRRHKGYREPGLEPEVLPERASEPAYDPRDPRHLTNGPNQEKVTYNRNRVLNQEPKVTRMQEVHTPPDGARLPAPHTPSLAERQERRDMQRRALEDAQQRSRLSAFDANAPDSKAPIMRNERGRLSTFDPNVKRDGVWGTHTVQGTEQWEEQKRLEQAPPRLDAFGNEGQRYTKKTTAFDRQADKRTDPESRMLKENVFNPEGGRINSFSNEIEDKTGLPTYRDPHPVTVSPFKKPN